jgi:Yip1 domain
MAVTTEILATYRGPGRVVARLLSAGQREDRALAILMAAAVVIFVAQWPAAARQAHFDPSVPVDGRLAGPLMSIVFVMPLLAYAIAGISHVLLRAFGGRGSFWSARIALFWALLAVSPLMLLQGLVAGFVGPGAGLAAIGLMVFAVFLWFWVAGLWVAEFGGDR